jgi:hypothetical protein
VRTFSFPSEPNFFKNSLSIKMSSFVVIGTPLPANPRPKRCVLLVTVWHHAMAILQFELDKLFTSLVPGLVVTVVAAVIFPSEPNFAQTFLSIKSIFVVDMMLLMSADLLP